MADALERYDRALCNVASKGKRARPLLHSLLEARSVLCPSSPLSPAIVPRLFPRSPPAPRHLSPETRHDPSSDEAVIVAADATAVVPTLSTTTTTTNWVFVPSPLPRSHAIVVDDEEEDKKKEADSPAVAASPSFNELFNEAQRVATQLRAETPLLSFRSREIVDLIVSNRHFLGALSLQFDAELYRELAAVASFDAFKTDPKIKQWCWHVLAPLIAVLIVGGGLPTVTIGNLLSAHFTCFRQTGTTLMQNVFQYCWRERKIHNFPQRAFNKLSALSRKPTRAIVAIVLPEVGPGAAVPEPSRKRPHEAAVGQNDDSIAKKPRLANIVY